MILTMVIAVEENFKELCNRAISSECRKPLGSAFHFSKQALNIVVPFHCPSYKMFRLVLAIEYLSNSSSIMW
jgi:hypothetical protein